MLLLSFALAKTYNQQERYVRRTSIFPFIYRRLMSRYKIFIDLSFYRRKQRNKIHRVEFSVIKRMKKTLTRFSNSIGRGKLKKKTNNKNNTHAKVASDCLVSYSFKSPRTTIHGEPRHVRKKVLTKFTPLFPFPFQRKSLKNELYVTRQCQTSNDKGAFLSLLHMFHLYAKKFIGPGMI